MLTCIVLAGQIVLSSATGQTIVFPEGMGVRVRPDIDKEYTGFQFFDGTQKENGEVIQTNALFMRVPYAEVASALSDCRTD